MTEAAVTLGAPELPEYSLGWDVMAWCSRNLRNVDGRRWIFTPEQAAFVLSWYGIDEEGNWLYRRGVLRRMKGWGKDPLAAVLAVCEWIGPCRFGGWSEDGQPRAVPLMGSWVQIAGATATQAEQNTMTLFASMIPERLQRRAGLRLGVRLCWAPGRRRIQAVSNAARGLEGARPTFVIEGETQHWVRGNGGLNLAEVLRRNLAKSPGGSARALAITNAHMDGEDSVAERDWLARHNDDVLYDSREAPPGIDVDDDDQVKAGILAARGDSVWVDADRVLAEFRDPATPPATNIRYFHNRVVAGVGAWMDPSTWAAAEEDLKPSPDGVMITLGFDGSVRRDATALVATDLASGAQWVAGIWERDWNDAAWEVPIDQVHDVVEEVRTRWQVMRFYADPAWWEESIARWSANFKRRDGKHVVAAWHTGGGNVTRMARALRGYMTAVEDGSCVHGRDPVFERHVLAAQREPLRGRAGEDGLYTIRKQSRVSLASIDAAMAAVLSWQACLDSRGDGDLAIAPPTPLRLHLPPGL